MTLDFVVRVENLEKVNRKIGRIDRSMNTISIMEFAQQIADRAKLELQRRYVRDRTQTGRLAASIRPVSVQRGKEAIVVAEAFNEGFPYALAVEKGRKAIVAPSGRLLTFMGREGFPVFTRKVRAVPGKHFMSEAARWGKKNIRSYMEKKIDRIIQAR